MANLVENLKNASHRLVFALGEYVSACSAIQEHCKRNPPDHRLTDRIASELLLCRSLEDQLRKDVSMVNYAKEYSLPKATIDSLPSEILIRIFHLVVGSRPCGVRKRSDEKIRFPIYPDYLSHVCSRWRKLALGTPTLWTHIDYVPHHPLSANFEDRAFVAAKRSKLLSLDLHIYEPAFHEGDDRENLLDFLAETSFAIRSLEIVLPKTSQEFSMATEYLEVLFTYFHNCHPGLFDKLTITDAGESAPIVVWPAEKEEEIVDSGVDSGVYWMAIDKDVYERMLPLKALRLDGVYFPWHDPIYHNLVDLRLTSSRKPAAMITRLELIKILKLNPKLQILHLGLNLLFYPSFIVDKARLPELQVLDLTSMVHGHLDLLAHLLDPGPRALQFSITLKDADLPVYSDEVLGFVSGSHITKLYVVARDVIFLREREFIDDLLHPAPHVQELAMDGFHWPRRFDIIPGPCECSVEREGPRLEVLYILNSHVYLYALQQMVEYHQTKKIVLWDCKVWGLDGRRSSLSESEIKSGLSDVCKSVCVLDGGPSPVEHWEW